MHTKTHFAWILAAGCGLSWAAGAALAADPEAATPAASAEQIEAWIQQLGAESFSDRTAATRALCQVGRAALEPLRKAAGSSEPEVALRARALVPVLDQLLFSGVEVELAFSKSSVKWDEPVDLHITMTNRLRVPARIPFPPEGEDPVTSADDAEQVGRVLDVADWLFVSRGDQPVDLHVDNILDDDDVREAIDSRIAAPPSSLLPPGEKRREILRFFNRGWARYQMLEEGTYKVRLEYVPAWRDDPWLTEHEVGKVASSTAQVMVSAAAPATVSRSGEKADVRLERKGDDLVASLVVRTDQARLINMNFGPSPPFAEGFWLVGSGKQTTKIPVAARVGASWHDVTRQKFVSVAAGESIELARIRKDALLEACRREGLVVDTNLDVRFEYRNVLDQTWQRVQGAQLLENQDAPPWLREPLPRKLLALRLKSEPLSLEP